MTNDPRDSLSSDEPCARRVVHQRLGDGPQLLSAVVGETGGGKEPESEHSHEDRDRTRSQAPEAWPDRFRTLALFVLGRTSVAIDLQGRVFATRAEARRAILRWINWYNTKRLHSTLDHVSPLEWEQRYLQAS